MWVWDLAALMLRSRKSWLRMVPMAVALLIMTVSLGVNRSINLSPEQSVTSTLGAADGLVSPGFSVLAGSSSPTVPINRWKVRQINPYLETQVSVKGLPEEVLYQESSQLDRRNSQMVFELLRALAEDEKGRTVVLSSHDPTAKEYAHRSCELVDGHLEDSC